MTYRLTEAALDDLDHIDVWIASNFGDAAALKARRDITATFARLVEFQRMGITRPDVTPKPVRFFASPHNWIIYEPGDPVLIHRVFPARMDLHNLAL